MSKLSFWLLLPIATLIYGCSQPTPPASAPAIFPLTEGNTWVYQISEFDSTNTVQWNTFDTVSIGGTITFGSETWHEVIHTMPNTGFTEYYIAKNEGLWQKTSIPLVYHTNLIYKYPATVNDTFNVTLQTWPASDPTRLYTEVISVNENLVVPLGSFSCVHYVSHTQSIDSATMKVITDDPHSDAFVSPGIGMIKSVNRLLRQTGALTWGHFRDETVLVSYSLH